MHRRSVASTIVVAFVSIVFVARATSECCAAEQTRSYLIEKFQDGDIPTGQDFADMIDSALNFVDDRFHLLGTATASDGRASLLVEGMTVDESLSYGQPAGLSNAWAGNSGFMAVQFAQGPETHYGYFQLRSGQPGSSALYPMHFEFFVWEDQAGAALVTAPVPEPSTGVLCCLGLVGFAVGVRRRRRAVAR